MRARGRPRNEEQRKARARCSWLLPGFLLVLAASWGGSCLLAPRLRLVPVDPAAGAALEHARELLRAAELPGETGTRDRARAELERALALAPDWVAPARLRDEIERAELCGVETLAGLRAELEREPGDAGRLYRAARLEGREGSWRFELARRSDPNLAWAHHGLAWAAAGEGRAREAVQHARRALARAREPYERSFFSASLARALASADEREQALELLEARLREPELSEVDRLELGTELALLGLASEREPRVRQASDVALALLGEAGLSEREVARLCAALRAVVPDDGEWRTEILGAIARHSSPARDRVRAELSIEGGPSALALGLLERGRDARESPLLRAARFAAGDGGLAVERWLAALPRSLCGADGLPRDARLAAVVRAARARAIAPESAPALVALGEALLDAGWFHEARAVAEELARADLARALELDARALASLSAFSGLRRALQDLDLARDGRARLAGRAADANPPRDLADLLAHFDRLLAPSRAPGVAGGLADSPRLSYGMVGELVHPGPWYSAADEAAGLGPAGQPVGGLAHEMARLNRFALFGQLAGEGPDGAVLARVLVESRAGEHLGVPWSGTVAWCEGADLEPRAARAGAAIGAAALHEGYWLDLQAARDEQAGWQRLAQEFAGPEGETRRARALATRGLPLGGGDEESLARARAASTALLGEGQRLRLALLAQRGVPELEEFVAVMAMHEEGHLCDRTRFLPLALHLPRALGLLLDCGFSPRRVMQALEYRAQLVALCDAPDPRLPLAQVLDAAEGGGDGLTPHARAYADLLRDLLARLERELALHPGLDPGCTLAQQWHLLAPDELRALARGLAHAKGLDRR